MGRTRWLHWLLRWLSRRKRKPGNAASEAIEIEPNTGGERPAEAIRQAPAVDDSMPTPTQQPMLVSPVASGGGNGDVPSDALGDAPDADNPAVYGCKVCNHPDVEVIDTKQDKGQTGRSIAREYKLSEASVRRHKRHRHLRKTMSEIWRRADAEAPPEGTDPLLWELGQLRKVAQDALAHAAKTRNLMATASLLRAANGLLELVAKGEKTKAEELKAQQATATLQDEQAVREEFDRWLDALRERMLAAQAAAPKCPRCGQALPYGVHVEEEEPKPAGPGVH